MNVRTCRKVSVRPFSSLIDYAGGSRWSLLDGYPDRVNYDKAPALLLIGGFAGTGKSTLGQEIARLSGFAFFDKDTLTAPLVERLLDALGSPAGIHDRDSQVYLTQVRPSEYACFLNAVTESVGLGVSTVAVAPFLHEMSDTGWRKEFEAACCSGETVAHVHYLWVFATDETLRYRLRQRGFARDLAKLQDWDQYAAGMRSAPPPANCLQVKSSEWTVARDQAARILEMLHLRAI